MSLFHPFFGGHPKDPMKAFLVKGTSIWQIFEDGFRVSSCKTCLKMIDNNASISTKKVVA